MQKPALQLASSHGVPLDRAGCVAAPDAGRVLLAACSSAVSSLSLSSGMHQTITFAAGNNKAIGCIAYSQASKCLALGEAGFKPAVHIRFDGAQGPALALRGHNFGIQALAWNPQGTLLASTGIEKDRQLMLWNPVSGALLGKTKLDADYTQLEFLDAGILCGINGKTLTVWVIEKTPSTHKLSARHFVLDLPADGCKPPAHIICLAPVHAAPVKRLWVALDNGHVLQLRTNGKCERALDTKVGRLLHAAVSPQHIACATAAGDVKVYDAATLEEAVTLACPGASASSGLSHAAVSCVFSPDGSQLTALFTNGTLASWGCSANVAEAALEYSTSFHSSPIMDATLIQRGSQSFVASCSQDGKVQVLQLEEGLLSYPATSDLRQHQQLRGVRLSSLAASPDGSLLAAGDTMGSIHLFTVFDTAPDYFRSVAVHSGAEVTAMAFAPPFSNGQHSCQLLAVGSKSGAITVLDSMHGYAVVVALQEVQGTSVASVKWVQQGSQLRLLTAAGGRDGRLEAYSVHVAAEGQVSFACQDSYRRAAPKGHLVGMHTAVWGQVAAAASKEGSIRIFDAISGDDLVSLTTDKNAGEVTTMVLDEGICIAVSATSKNMLQIYDRNAGKLLASSKAHLPGARITRVLINPDNSHIVTVGDDACIRAWAVPEDIRLRCLEEQQRLRQTVQQMSQAKSGATTAATETSSLLPHNLFDEHFRNLHGMSEGSGNTAAASAAPASGEVSSSNVEVAAEEEGQAEEQQVSAPSPSSRHQGIVGSLAAQFGALEAQFQTMKASPRCWTTTQSAGERQEATANPPPTQPPPAAAPAISLAAILRSGGPANTNAVASRPVARSGTLGSQSRRPATRQPWLLPREGPGLWVPMSGEDEIAMAEAERCLALLHCSEGTGPDQQCAAGEAARAVPAGAAAAAASPDSRQGAPAACPESVGSVPVRAKRGCWSFTPKASPEAVADRRPLSSLSAAAEGVNKEPDAKRPSTALGIESSPEEFTCWSDPSSPGVTFGSRFGPQASMSAGQTQASQGGAGSDASKRLSFSFNMAPAAANSKAQEEGDTPSFAGKAAAAASAANASVSKQVEPSLTLAPASSDASTPSLHLKAVCAQPQPAGANSKPGSAALLFETVQKPAAGSTSGAASQSATGAGGSDAAGSDSSPQASRPSLGLRGRPTVPCLSLSASPATKAVPVAPAALVDDGISLREQYSSARSSSRLRESPSPPLGQQRSRLSVASEMPTGLTGYATASSSNTSSSDTSSSNSDSISADIFDSPSATLASEAPVAVMAEEQDGGLFSPPKLHDNQLFEGSVLSECKTASQAGAEEVMVAPSISEFPKPSSGPEGPAAPKAAADAFQQIGLQPPSAPPASSADSGSSGGGSSGTSAFDRPPAYDPLEAAEAVGHKRRRQQTPMMQSTVTNSLFGFTPADCKGTLPFSAFNERPCNVAMAKNPAFAVSPTASPSCSMGAVNMRRMSTFLHNPAAGGTAMETPGSVIGQAASSMHATAPEVVRGSPLALPTAASTLASQGSTTSAAVLGLFQQAMQGLNALQAEGKADGELMHKLGQLGIRFSAGAGEASCGSQPSVGRGVSCEEAVSLSCQEKAALKAEILKELRKDILAGALKL